MSGYGNPGAEFRRQREALFALDAQTTPGLRRVRRQLRAMAALVEGVLCALWARQDALEPCALLAVGGLGRGELFPHSDIDVLVLLPEGARPDSDARLRKGIEDFITSCWDAGLEIGSSVRTVAQCLEASAADVSVQTALLEARHLAGPKALAAALMQQFDAAMDAKAFFIAKTLEMRQRHVKYEDTPYALEPNCKESPGGLRDLQVILWVTRAAGYGSSWEDLARNGLATRLEARNLRRCEELLGLVRIQLHLMAGRREDRLLFDLQTQVAHSLGYWPEPDAFDEEDGQAAQRRRGRSQLPGERLMRRYYWTAKGVRQLNQILLLNIEERLGGRSTALEPINGRFADRSGMLEVASDDLYLKNPQAILETFLLYETSHPKLWDLSVRTLRALYNARHVMDAAFRRDPVNRQTFMKILQQPAGITHALRLMNQTSVLGRYLPAFRRIVGRMQHDLFHVYTVDQHILMVVRNIRRFFIAEHAHEYPLCSAIASELEKPWRLYVAALFHDIAKGRGGDHSLLGAADALRFCRRHEVAADDTEFITFLVREHLLMSAVAQKSDISDPVVIAGFARRVGTEQRLNALYLLTVADIRGTSPRVWNAWKGKLLEDLYHITLRVLGGNSPDAGAEVQMRRQEALRLLALAGQAGNAHEPLWETLDVGYFMHHDAGDIAWHTRELAGHVGSDATIVRARVSPVSGEGLQVMVYTPRLQALFARCSGYFERSGYSIVEAQIHTTASQYALNTFHVVAPALADRWRDCIGMIENDLARDIERAGPLPAPVHGRVSRRVRSFPVTPRVKLTPDEKASHWVLSVSASDRPGLLYSIARVLAGHGLSVLMARIATLGERVEDTFLIEGDELRHNRAQIALETELLWTIADG